MQIFLYTNPGCCLCERLEEMIAPFLSTAGIVLSKRHLIDDENWRALYWDRIPVLVADGEVILEGRPEPAEVERAMRKLLGAASPPR